MAVSAFGQGRIFARRFVELILIILCILLSLLGLAGCVFPGLPGLPLNFGALLILQWQWSVFSNTLLWVMALLTLIVSLLDYFLPIWTAKKYGATRQGVIGSLAGMTLGAFLTPVGMIAGLIIGSLLGDLYAGKSLPSASRSAGATVFGTLLSIGIKLILAAVMIYYLVSRIIIHYAA